VPVDTRFYERRGTLSLGELAEKTGAELKGDAQIELTGISSAANGRRGDIGFLDGDGKSPSDVSADISALVVNDANIPHVPDGVPYLVSRFPRHVQGVAGAALFRPRHADWQGEARISPDASLDDSVRIGPGACIGPGAVIGSDTVIGPNAVIGPGVQIGRKCSIGAGASLFNALIGDHVKLLAGVRIGEAGFGVMPGPNGAEDAPHYGRVILQDHVTVGANSCIDRGAFDDTILGERCRIDNLCQIAHNVVLGRSVLVAAFGGISGSVQVGDGSMLGGRVGIADHVKVGEGVSLAASAGLFRDVEAGETWGGTPAKPIRQWMREVAWLQKNSNPKKKG
jgi:UDP-3-O-[3-hydroxymyristoyl] glucosamine N-acyltransferase